LRKLYLYKDPLDHSFYKQTIYDKFSKFYSKHVDEGKNLWELPTKSFTKEKILEAFGDDIEGLKRYIHFFFFTSHTHTDDVKL